MFRSCLALAVALTAVGTSDAQGPIRSWLNGGGLFRGPAYESCTDGSCGTLTTAVPVYTPPTAFAAYPPVQSGYAVQGDCGTLGWKRAGLFKSHRFAAAFEPMPLPMTAENVAKAAAAPKNGMMGDRVFHTFVRLKVAAELRKRGMSVIDAHTMSQSLTAEMIDSACGAVKIPAKALGDGTIIQAIIDFFKSPTGQALLKALVEYLIMILGVADSGANPVHDGLHYGSVVPSCLDRDQRDRIAEFYYQTRV